ncbi:MAG: hypothetical protein V7785_16525 [Bermanella sp.]
MNNIELVTFASIISVGLIKSSDYIPWCDDIILTEDNPPEFIMDMSLLKDEDAAAKRLVSEAYENFSESYSLVEIGYYEICASFLIYQSGETNWEEFLRSAILIAEHGPCQLGGYELNQLLEIYLENGAGQSIAEIQVKDMGCILKEQIEEIRLYQSMIETRDLTITGKATQKNARLL